MLLKSRCSVSISCWWRTSLNDARDTVLEVRRLLGNDAGNNKASAVLAHLAASIATELRSPAAAKAEKGSKRAPKAAAKPAAKAPAKRAPAKRAPARAHALQFHSPGREAR